MGPPDSAAISFIVTASIPFLPIRSMETLRISSILPRLRSCFGTRRSTLFVAPSLKSDIRNHSPYALAHGPPPAPPSEQFHGNGYGGRRDAAIGRESCRERVGQYV